jgi:hypothetical protein
MVFKTLLIVLVFAVLLEDSASIRKTEEEIEEDAEIAAAVNRTLAEEEKKQKKEEDEKKKKMEKKKLEDPVVSEGSGGGSGGRDEALPSSNITCPTPKECQLCGPCKEEDCPPCKSCEKCPELGKCPPCERCPVEQDCPPCQPCQPCKPGVSRTLDNSTIPDCPAPPVCSETGGMSVPVALVVGAMASLLVTGVATAIGLLLRYTSPIFSGLLFIFIVVLTWYLSSYYPETARELGGRAATLLREAVMALSHRVVGALRHHNEQVGVLILSLISSLE